MAESDCREYCEGSTRCGPLATRPAVQQPLNTWSNLGFLFVGLLAAVRRPRPWREPDVALFAASCALLFLGSFLFHAALVRPFQWLDVVGMYVALSALAARGLHLAFGVGWRTLVPAWAGANLLLAVFKWWLPTFLLLGLLGGAVGLAMALLVRSGRGRPGAALVPLGLFALAFVIRELDVRRVLCWPDSLLYQGHAVWHLLCAAMLWSVWRFFERAETDRDAALAEGSPGPGARGPVTAPGR